MSILKYKCKDNIKDTRDISDKKDNKGTKNNEDTIETKHKRYKSNYLIFYLDLYCRAVLRPFFFVHKLS